MIKKKKNKNIKSLHLAAWTWINGVKFSIEGKGHSHDAAASLSQNGHLLNNQNWLL